MRKFKDEIVTTGNIAKEFRLSEVVAREIVAEETRKALLRHWQAWLLVFCGFSVAFYIYFRDNGNSVSALWILIITAGGWMLMGRYFARSAIRTAAHQKSERIHGSHT